MSKKIDAKPKKKAWDVFSRFIRVRDCLETTGLAFVGICITCERRFHISALQAGHCIPGRGNGLLFHEKLTNIQCRYCNEVKHGCQKKYERIMSLRYGKKKFEKMVIKAKKVIPDMDYKAIEEKYKDKYITLMRAHGFKTYGELLRSGR